MFDRKNYRIPKETEDRIAEVKRETDVRKALEGVADLAQNYIYFEERAPTRFDPDTGRPIEFEWRPAPAEQTSFPARIPNPIFLEALQNLNPPESYEPGLSKVVVDAIRKNNPLLVETRFGPYVFQYAEPCGFGQDACETRSRIVSYQRVHRLS